MLYIFVEGQDDENFFSKIFFDSQEVKYYQYSKEKIDKVNCFIRSIKCMPNSQYIFFTDADGESIEAKQEKAISAFNQLEREKVFIVQYEIENWYYAGVCESDCRKIKMKHFELNTNGITKEKLISKMQRPSDKLYIMSKMLDLYSINLAVQRNDSLKTFVNQKESIAAV